MNPELRRYPLVFVDDLACPVLSRPDRDHLYRSRRLSDGSPINVSDGRGNWATAVLGADVKLTSAPRSVPRPAAEVAIGFVPVKGEKPEAVVRRLTELGVDRIVVMTSERSVVRWDGDRLVRQSERWLTSAREACGQSRRPRFPRIVGPVSLDSLGGESLILCEPGGPPLAGLIRSGDSCQDSLICVGPEGGWGPSELLERRQASLPGGILRAETAALTAAVVAVEARQSE